MTDTLQPVLSCGERTSSDLTVFLSGGGTTYEVYIGIALLERVAADPDDVARKMLVGRLYNAGAPVTELGETFGHDPRTIKKWAAALLTGDIEEIARAFAGREGRRKTSPELIRYCQQLYRDRHLLGRKYREVIIEKVAHVFGVRISTTVASAIFASARKKDESGKQAGDRATALRKKTESSSEQSGSVNQSPIPLPAQTSNPGGARRWIHHAGQVLFAEGMKAIADPLQRQFIGQILQGAVNVEQSKTLCGRSLSSFTGPVANDLKEQRDRLGEQACAEEVIRAYARNAELLCDGPDRGELFYFDPHTKEYTGQLKVLKGWCGRRHGVVKALNLDSFHTQSGRPCFIRHYGPYYDMRERFFMSLAEFNLLFAPDKRRRRTFVIDRGIYALPTLQSFGSDYVITWEKNYRGDGWDEGLPVIAFSRSLPKNSRGDLHTTQFQCQQTAWRRDASFRRIIVRATKESGRTCEASIVTSHPDMDIQDVVWPMFRRWLQENDFKYLDTHFGINQLTSRDNASFANCADRFEDRSVESPQYRNLKSELKAAETNLAKDLLKLRRLQTRARDLQIEKSLLQARRQKLISRLRKCIQRLTEGHRKPRGAGTLEDDIKQFHSCLKRLTKKNSRNAEQQTETEEIVARTEDQIGALEARLCKTLREQSRLQLLIDGEYRLLDTRKKALMDVLRVTASNIFRNVQEQFRAICDNFRDDHVLVRMLSRCSGTMQKTSDATTFQLWLPGTLQPHRIRAIEELLAEIERRTNAAIPAARPIRIELLSGPISV